MLLIVEEFTLYTVSLAGKPSVTLFLGVRVRDGKLYLLGSPSLNVCITEIHYCSIDTVCDHKGGKCIIIDTKKISKGKLCIFYSSRIPESHGIFLYLVIMVRKLNGILNIGANLIPLVVAAQYF